jgi:hypothetical protein
MQPDFPTSFTHRIVAPSISAWKGYPVDGGVDPDLKDEAPLVYPFANASLEFVQTQSVVPLAWMRAVYALQVGFASECFIDELAAAAGRDPLEYRLHILSKDEDIKYFDATWHPARMRPFCKWLQTRPDGVSPWLAAIIGASRVLDASLLTWLRSSRFRWRITRQKFIA